MLLDEVLIWEAVAVDGFASKAVTHGDITTLEHELRNHSVEWGPFVAEALLTGTEGSEVLGGLWNNLESTLVWIARQGTGEVSSWQTTYVIVQLEFDSLELSSCVWRVSLLATEGESGG